MIKYLLLTALVAGMPIKTSLANLLKNSDFEAGKSDDKTYPFWQTPGWYNLAKNGPKQDANARTSLEGSTEGSKYSAVFNDHGEDISYFAQKTEHTIAAGEIFEVSLDWISGYKWKSHDVLRVVVFATANNNIGGQRLWEDTFDFEFAPKGTWDKVNHAFKPAPLEADDKPLFFGFYGVDPTQGLEVGFGRLDNIVLTVKPK